MKRFAFIVALLALLGLVSPARADSAQAVVKSFYAQLEASMKQGGKLGFAGRCKKLDPAIRAAFDLPLMTRMAVGSSWAEASPRQQSDLIAAFSDFSVASYASRFAAYDGERFTVIDEKSTNNGTIVETSLKPRDSDPVSLNYLMRADDNGHYRIVDVFINGTISELSTRRAEFSSIARKDGVAALVNSLGQKSRQMGPS